MKKTAGVGVNVNMYIFSAYRNRNGIAFIFTAPNSYDLIDHVFQEQPLTSVN